MDWKNNTEYKLSKPEANLFAYYTQEKIIDKVLPEAERSGEDAEPIRITIAGITMEMPLNSEIYHTIISAVKECAKIESE